MGVTATQPNAPLIQTMPFTLQSFDFSIICGEDELEMYDVKQEGSNSTTAFVASEAGKQFRIVITNNLLDFDLRTILYIDGERVSSYFFRAGQKKPVEFRGVQNSATTVLPFKFQELETVDPDLEHALVGPEMGTIEVQAFRCRYRCSRPRQPSEHAKLQLHQGRVSERSKKAGWHHVSTADEVPCEFGSSVVTSDNIDPNDAPFESLNVVYRPKELLMAQGVVVGHDVGTGISEESEVNDRKRARDGETPGPSKRRTGPTIKKEETSDDVRRQRIQVLQGNLNSIMNELNSLMGEQSGSSVKPEIRSPSPIVVGQAAGTVIDLTD